MYVNSGILGGASQFYLRLNHGQNKDGILSSLVKQYANTGIQPLLGLFQFIYPEMTYSDTTYIMNGYMKINWYLMENAHFDLYTECPAGDIDFYSVILHEAFHLLDFSSLLGDYYIFSKFDTHIYLDTVKAITFDSCYNWSRFPLIYYLGQCGPSFLNYHMLDSQAIYTDTIYQPGSSFSHFNCQSDSGYVMNAYYTNPQRTPHNCLFR
jgi:hypothetical protein